MALEFKEGEVVRVFLSDGATPYGICKTISRRGRGRFTVAAIVASTGVLKDYVVQENQLRKLKGNVKNRASKLIKRARDLTADKTQSKPTFKGLTVKKLKDMLRAQAQSCKTSGNEEELMADPREESDASSESSDSSEESLFDEEHDDFMRKRLKPVPDFKLKAVLEEFPNAEPCTTHEELVDELIVQLTNEEKDSNSRSSSEMSDDSQSLGGAEPNDSAIVTKMHDFARALLNKTSEEELVGIEGWALNDAQRQHMTQYMLGRLTDADDFVDMLKRHARLDWFHEIMFRNPKDNLQGTAFDPATLERRARYGGKLMAHYCVSHATTDFWIIKGGVNAAEVDCIVNAANNVCLGGAGIDGVISRMGGEKMYQERVALPIVVPGTQTRCKTGNAVWTSAGDGALKCTGVIHAVGPRFPEERQSIEQEAKYIEQLILAYKSAMEIARDKGAKSVAFCPLSSGIFRGHMSLRDILKIALNAICAHVYDGLTDVELHLFAQEEQREVDSILDCREARATRA